MVNGLSDKTQALIVMLSGFFMAIGTAGAAIPDFVPSDFKAQFAIIFWLAGILGFSLKEALGTQTTATPSTPSTKS